jgi:hypothetical protein
MFAPSKSPSGERRSSAFERQGTPSARTECDLRIVVVSTKEAHRRARCLSTAFEHARDAGLDAIVVDNCAPERMVPRREPGPLAGREH